MADHRYGLRPDVETFEHAGCRLTLVDAADILATARAQRVDLLHGGAFPAPVRKVTLSVAAGLRDGRPVHLMAARIRVDGGRPGPDGFGTPILEVASPVA